MRFCLLFWLFNILGVGDGEEAMNRPSTYICCTYFDKCSYLYFTACLSFYNLQQNTPDVIHCLAFHFFLQSY